MFGYTYLAFLIFNLITTYWVWHATSYGAIAAFLANTLLMTFCFIYFLNLIILVVDWLILDLLLFGFHLSTYILIGICLGLGLHWVMFFLIARRLFNGMSIGFLGGSLWVLIINLFSF